MQGEQKRIYDRAKLLLETQKPNFSYINSDNLSQLRTVLTDTQCFKGSRMQQVKGLIESVEAEISSEVTREVEQAQEEIGLLQERMGKMADFSQLSPVQQQEILKSFQDCCDSIAQEDLIAMIRSTRQKFETDTYPRLLSKMTKLTGVDGVSSQATRRVKESETQYIPSQTIKVNFGKAWLADEADVEEYLSAMREALMAEIKEGKRIQI